MQDCKGGDLVLVTGEENLRGKRMVKQQPSGRDECRQTSFSPVSSMCLSLPSSTEHGHEMAALDGASLVQSFLRYIHKTFSIGHPEGESSSSCLRMEGIGWRCAAIVRRSSHFDLA